MNLYEILGVSIDDPAPKIKARYRQLALQTHPDVAHKIDPLEFTRYAQAYKVLGKPKKRLEYNAECGIQVRPRALKLGHDLHQHLILSHAEALVGGVPLLAFKRYEPCSRCWLAGCARCAGHGLIPVEVTVRVRVPAGTTCAITVFVEGCGGVSEPGGERGHLLVYVSLID